MGLNEISEIVIEDQLREYLRDGGKVNDLEQDGPLYQKYLELNTEGYGDVPTVSPEQEKEIEKEMAGMVDEMARAKDKTAKISEMFNVKLDDVIDKGAK